MQGIDRLPIAVVGAGPVGLAAAAHLLERGLPVRIYEAGPRVGAHALDWGHVRLFSPWVYNIDAAARRLLARQGWAEPDPDAFPTGRSLVEEYLAPLARTPEIAVALETRTRVAAITRLGLDKVTSRDRGTRPFVLTLAGPDDRQRRVLAQAVIDASGTWVTPNPLGADGLPAEGEAALADRIAYGIPDVLGRDRGTYANRTVLVAGAGHSAANVLLDLAALAREEPGTRIHWVTRGTNLARVYGGGLADGLPARGDLGARLASLVASGGVALTAGLAITAVRASAGGVEVVGVGSEGERCIGPVDRIVAATGQRPDLGMTRELRLELDPWLESARALGPLIDPNLHSCGSVPPHGHRELSHPEPGFYTVGVKSYGRAPTFLMLTGYEQVRSIAAALAGDMEAADRLHLVLPETGVCSTGPAVSASCCTPSKMEAKEAAACCGRSPPDAADTAGSRRAEDAGCTTGCGSPASALATA